MILIPEDHVGMDDDTVAYPNISTCLSITVNTKGGPLIGTHLTIGTSTGEIDGIFGKMVDLAGGKQVKEILVAGVITEWSQPRVGRNEAYLLPGLKDQLFSIFRTSRVVSLNTSTNLSKDNHTLVHKDENEKITARVWTAKSGDVTPVTGSAAAPFKDRLWKVKRDGSLMKAPFISSLNVGGTESTTLAQNRTYDLKF